MFHFKQFSIDDARCGMKLGTDSVLLGAWTNIVNASKILDLGCGSGILALMAAQRSPSAEILAIDISEEAVSATLANAQTSPWAQRITAKVADACSYTPPFAPDLIICNPPYFSSTLISPDALRATARHGQGLTPATAIDCAARWLTADGRIAMITPYDDWQGLLFHAEMLRLKLRHRCDISSVEGKQPSRILWEFSSTDGPIVQTHLYIRTKSGEYTAEYRALTSPFYLHFIPQSNPARAKALAP